MATSGMDPTLLQVEALLVEKNRSEKDKNNANFLSEPLNKITVQEIEKSVLLANPTAWEVISASI